MYSDYLFRGLLGILRMLAVLPASASRFQVLRQITMLLHPTLLHPVLVSPEPPRELLCTLRNCATRSHLYFRCNALAAQKIRNLFSPGRHAPTNGKEVTPC